MASESTPTSAPPKFRSLYFGYGSNLWLHQMSLRCPSSPYIGVARLDGWRFIINQRGVATIVPSDPNSADDKGNHVFGLAYDLAEIDEETLDINEGVPFQYIKEYMRVRLWDGRKVDDAGVPIIPDVSTDVGSEEVDALVKVLFRQVLEGVHTGEGK